MRKPVLAVILFICNQALSQSKPVVFQQQTWVSYNQQFRLSGKWATWFDSEIHTTENYFTGLSQATFRFGGTFYNAKGNKFTGGYGFSEFFPGENHKTYTLPEHFGWQQYQWFHNTEKKKLMQWVRLEEKWKKNAEDDLTATANYINTYKIRYNILYQFALSRRGFVPGSLSLAVSNELYLYYGPRVNNHLFDQDRIFLGCSYAVNTHDNLMFGFLNIIQEDLSGTQFKDNNVIKLSYFQNIDMRRHAE